MFDGMPNRSSIERFRAALQVLLGERTQNSSAKSLGLKQRTLNAYIRGDRADVRLSTLDKVAEAGGYQGWQILVPGFDPRRPPALAGDTAVVAATDDERALLAYYRSLGPEGKRALLSVRIMDNATPEESQKRLGESAA